MKKMFIFLLLILLAGVLIKGCTTINLSPNLFFNYSKYKQFPELGDDLRAEGFSLNRITQSRNNDIRYFPEKNFFMVLASNKAGHFNPIKIDSVGNKVFELDITLKHSLGQTIEIINCFMISKDRICDFSADKPTAELFSEVLNKDGDVLHKEWVEDIFGKLYNASEIVLYGREDGRYVVYFHHQGKWTKLYAPNKYPYFVYPATGSEIKCEINDEDIPHKWHEEVYLKDVQNATYSNEHRYTDNYITPFNSDSTFFPNQMLNYPQTATIKTLAFAKETYTSEGYYNPGIPVQFYGKGYYALEIENTVLNFKTVASEAAFFGKVETNLHLFGLPLQYANKSNVRLLTYDYGTNFHENNKKGTYILRKNK